MATQIGEVTILYGKAFAQGPDGIRELSPGSSIYNDDVVTTEGKSALEIQFTDGALLSQGANSRVHLDDYVFDPDSDAGEITMDLLEGTFRSVTGQIVDMNPEGFRIDTPNTTIGIRGTTTGHIIPPTGAEEHVVIDFVDKPVVFQPAGGGPLVVITQDGMGLSASSGGLGTVQPAQAGILSQLEQLSSESLQHSPPDPDGQDGDSDPEDGSDEAPGDGEEGPEGEGEGEPQAAEGGGEEQPAEVLPQQPAGQPPLLQAMEPAPPPPPPVVAPPAPATAPPPPPLPPPREEEPAKEEPEPDDDDTQVDDTIIDLSGRTDPMTINLAGGPPPYFEVTGDSDTRVDISANTVKAVGSSTQANTITGDDRANQLTGGAANDTIDGGMGNDTIFSTGGTDQLNGGSDTDLVSYLTQDDYVQVDLSAGTGYKNHTATTDALSNFEDVYGSNFNDTIYGDAAANTIHGNDGADFIWGNGGADSLFGGAGDDIFKFSANAAAGTTLDGGDGIDYISIYSSCDLSGLSSASNIETLTFFTPGTTVTVESRDFDDFSDGSSGSIEVSGGGSTETFNINAAEAAGEEIDLSTMTLGNWEASDVINITGFTGNDTLFGSSVNDTINGGAGNDYMSGGFGSDVVNGEAGNDLILGSPGVDTLTGGTDNDTLSYEHLDPADGHTRIVVDLNTNTTSDDGQGASDSISGFEVLMATTLNDLITTSSTVAYTIDAKDGDDSITYKGQADSILGGAGNDQFIFEADAAASTSFNGGSGTDTLLASNNTVLDVRQASLTDFEAINIDGSTTELQMSTTTASGMTWDVSIDSGAKWSLFGGIGNDLADLSNMTFSTFVGSIEVKGSSGNDTLDMGHNMSSKIHFDGEGGSDTLVYTDNGAGGDELTYVTNVEFISLGDETTIITTTDSLVASGDTLTVDGSNLTNGHFFNWNGDTELDGAFNLSGGYGSDLLVSGSGNDTLTGNSGADTLMGGIGNDYLFGGIGADELHGYIGNDTFYYLNTDDAGDLIFSYNESEDSFNFELTNFNDQGNLTSGAIGASFFKEINDLSYQSDGSSSIDADDAFVYLVNGSTYELYYDSNGSDAGGQTLITTFDSDCSLLADDIIMV